MSSDRERGTTVLEGKHHSGLYQRGRKRPNLENWLETCLKLSVLLFPCKCVGSGGVLGGGDAFAVRVPDCHNHGGGK